ncbi:MAG: acyl-ACP--UDP-N-acetylglucosamine O-acyltransferase [Gammaproteobacteria bacterium]|nr:acyl-ACP--UDP-N-acetylglucosamine O-acyltransferase [Gammaproteobacteria bacterium]
MIDKKAIIDPKAKIDENVTIEPYAVIGADVEIASGTWIGSHAVIKGPSRIGRDNKIFQFASIGEIPQDLKFQGEKTYLEIGERNTFREFCTINRGTVQDHGITKIGHNNLFMNYVHVAHDCVIGNDTIFANNASLAGHVHVGDYVILGGFAGVLQFCHLGAHSFISTGAIVLKDVLPYTKVSGVYAKPFGLNSVGMSRHGFSSETIMTLKRGYRVIYRQNLTVSEAIKELETMVGECPEIQLYIDMLEGSERGIVR